MFLKLQKNRNVLTTFILLVNIFTILSITQEILHPLCIPIHQALFLYNLRADYNPAFQ